MSTLIKSLAALKAKVTQLRETKKPVPTKFIPYGSYPTYLVEPQDAFTRAAQDAVSRHPMSSEVRVHEGDSPPRGRVITREE